MNKQKLWDKVTQAVLAYMGCEICEMPKEMRLEFFSDVNELIKKHQAPYKNALDNIACELNSLTEMEVKDAETIAKRLR